MPVSERSVSGAMLSSGRLAKRDPKPSPSASFSLHYSGHRAARLARRDAELTTPPSEPAFDAPRHAEREGRLGRIGPDDRGPVFARDGGHGCDGLSCRGRHGRGDW